MPLILGLILMLFALPAVGLAQDNPFAGEARPDAERYKACMAQVTAAPDVARDAARLWLEHEGGVPAKHCLGAALAALGRQAAGAAWMEEAADDLAQGRGHQSLGAVITRPLIADIKAEAAALWMESGDYERARARLTEAIALQPGGAPELVNLLVVRSQAAAGLGRYDWAREDLTAALHMNPDHVQAYVLRATAARFLGEYDEAELDLARALARVPDQADALLERGIVRRLTGDDAGARADWTRITELYPYSDTAELALDNLELLRPEE